MFKIILTTLVMLILVSPELKAVPGTPIHPEDSPHPILPSAYQIPVFGVPLQPFVGQPQPPIHHVVVQPAPPPTPHTLGPSHRMCNLVGRWIGGGALLATFIYFVVMDHIQH